ncbi:MAG: hypothetical protein M9948_08955 [Lentimicrobium sp.]|nr:hypothetical protein [Lentimicrobium sp.]
MRTFFKEVDPGILFAEQLVIAFNGCIFKNSTTIVNNNFNNNGSAYMATTHILLLTKSAKIILSHAIYIVEPVLQDFVMEFMLWVNQVE